MEFSFTQLQYIMTIYRLSRISPDVSSTSIAAALGVRKASVTKMMNNLMEQKLIVRERYGKIYLTAFAFLCVKRLTERAEQLEKAMVQLGWPCEDAVAGAFAAVCTAGQRWAAQWSEEAAADD